MISVVHRKRRLIIYLINLLGLLLYPLYFVFRRKWRNRKQGLLIKLEQKETITIGINCTDRLGDILFFAPTLKALKKSFPWIKCIILTNKTGSDIFKHNPFADDIILVDNFWVGKSLVGLREFIGSFNRKYFETIKEIKSRKLDVLIEVKGDFRNILFFDIWAGADCLLGYALSGFGWMLDWEIEHKAGLHEIDAKLSLAKALGADTSDREMEFYLSTEAGEFADKIFRANRIEKNDTIAVFHMGGTWGPKLWPIDNFIEIGKRLKEKYKARILLIGDNREDKIIEQFLTIIPDAIRLNDSTVSQSAAVIKKSSFFLGNDSGPLHLARSVKTPLIGIFGHEYLWRVGPEHHGIALQHRFDCAPCGMVTCDRKPNCVESITIEEVWQSIVQLLNRDNRARSAAT